MKSSNTELNSYFSCSSADCFSEDRFNKNFLNGIIDQVAYRHTSIQQRPDILNAFYEMILTTNPSQIIEIGTYSGGLTLILKDIIDLLDLNTNLYTYEVNDTSLLKSHISERNLKNIYSYNNNLFNYSNLSFSSDDAKNEIKNLIQQNGTTIVLCDGGYKQCEFNLLSQYLKPNDIIMAHDYAPNSDYFEQYMKNKIWNWHEIQDSDINNSCELYALDPYMSDEFLSVAWVCKKKRE